MKIQTNIVFAHLQESDKRITVEQGGTRSGKTYNIIEWFLVKLAKEEDKVLSICRETTPSLRNTVMRDFFEILKKLGWYNPNCWKESTRTYKLGSNTIEFLNLDDDQKVRGAKRDYLFINEANEVKLAIWKQLLFRTSGKIVLDYNPSDDYHWIYEEVIPRPDCDFYVTTYKDNPFLPQELVDEIERLKDIDPNYWKVYGLGERGMSDAVIFRNYELVDSFPEEPEEIFYGVDLGFNNPSAIIKVGFVDQEMFVQELLYESRLTVKDLIDKFDSLGIDKKAFMYVDNARPEAIEEFYRSGYNANPCIKGKDSVKAGIDQLKRRKMFLTKDSTNLLKEVRNYKWKTDKNGQVIDEPVKLNDHAIDALRYAVTGKIEIKDDFRVLDEFNF